LRLGQRAVRTAAYRVEQTRMQPSFAISCHQDQCIPRTGSFSALR